MDLKKIYYYDFSGVYRDSAGSSGYHDMSGLSGTNCYLDEVSKDLIRKNIQNNDVAGIHFIDSGNYHYMTLLFLERIREDFSLVLFDNHPDRQMPAFGSITSCGGWVQEALDSLPHLRHVYMTGTDRSLYDEMPADTKVSLNTLPDDQLPVYISVDKDVMSAEYARTDWSQGNMSLAELISWLKRLYSSYDILGLDICGEKKEDPADEDIQINKSTNQSILEALQLL